MGTGRVLEVLDTVLDATVAERAARLDALCGDDAELRREVERVLALENEAKGFLDGPAVHIEETAERLGPYRLLDVLGRGGMGTVYRAVRKDDFEKQVALKVLRRELVSPAMVDRFHAERQILARLEHPGIAHILDGGTLPDGRPYLVMEHVEGEPVDRFCADHALGLRQRLELFRRIAEAVAFAHRNLIVHRDVKPANVLVTAEGVPKLLDFGIAKLLADETPAAEGPGSGPMTPRYASPEQVAGERVTTASDVHGLGLLLYVMLTGTLPCGLEDCPLADVARRIREDEPVPVGRGADVDAIVAKALRKDPADRYASAEQLADDVGRYLAHLPVRARQGSWLYVAGKLARRRPGAALAAVLFVVFSLTSTVLWREAVAERRHAEAEQQRADAERAVALREQERAERVSSFLKDLFRSADPDTVRGGRKTVREVLDEGRARLAQGLEDEPELEATLAGTLGDVYRDLGLYDEAVELLRRSVELLRRLHAEPSALAQAIDNLASVLKQQGELAEAGELNEEASAIREAADGANSTDQSVISER